MNLTSYDENIRIYRFCTALSLAYQSQSLGHRTRKSSTWLVGAVGAGAQRVPDSLRKGNTITQYALKRKYEHCTEKQWLKSGCLTRVFFFCFYRSKNLEPDAFPK